MDGMGFWESETIFYVTDEENLEDKEETDRRRREVVNTFRTAPFEEIVARSEAKVMFHKCPRKLCVLIISLQLKGNVS